MRYEKNLKQRTIMYFDYTERSIVALTKGDFGSENSKT